jgi:DNA-binding transcriptional regulator GbsR (MarR family)
LARHARGAHGDDAFDNLLAWERLALDAVGNVIEFWGFKRNQGRLWALLYLRGQVYTAPELQRILGLSKGAVSMLTRELEQWRVIDRRRIPGKTAWHFEANTNLMNMIGRVLEEREGRFIARVKADLEEAQQLLPQDRSVPDDVRQRMEQMAALAERVEEAVQLFIRTARLDLRGIANLLSQGVGKRLARRKS